MSCGGAVASLGDAGAAASSLAKVILGRLLGQIYSGELAAGEVLSEAAQAERHGVSRGPVREATRRIQGFLLVTREPCQRARVASLTPALVRPLFEVRMALEGMACNLAARRMSAAELRDVCDELEASRALSATPPQRAGGAGDRVFDFHERIFRACGNERIADMPCGDPCHLLRVYRRSSGDMPDRRGWAFEEHWQILRALLARDGALAQSLMRAHIGRASELLLVEPAVGQGRT